ncbi:MAG: hypothetical protein LBS80_06065 [Tannerella sp.]|jgi:anti-anti-sigma regulatory factor|nr:hypothetical protein [Tannerella sp.]
METKTIRISELINESLRSRTEAQKLYAVSADCKERALTIDFSNVSFMSRSFADEFCEVVKELKKAHKTVVCINENENIRIMLQIVSENRGKAREVKVDGVVKEFLNFADLSLFMATL